MAEHYSGPLEKVDDCRWRIPRSYKPQMRVDGLIYASEALIAQLRHDKSCDQVANVACLPGIVGHSLAMPDMHWGYGFPIGGVAATDPEEGGVISPGGVGYDINCGVRLIRSDLQRHDAAKVIDQLVSTMFATVPSGVGQGGRIKFDGRELKQIMAHGSRYVVDKGFGWAGDLAVTEAGGELPDANPDAVSKRVLERGADQCGTLGSGNHFLEIQVVAEIHDAAAAEAFGLFENQVVVMIHSGSRGVGYQICEDALKDLRHVPDKYGIWLPDHQLVCAPVNSPEGQRYLGAMQAAANFAWANRQIMTYHARDVFSRVFDRSAEELGMRLVYDVAHNIAKMETYDVEGKSRRLCVHRKGATRAFPAGHPELPETYRPFGQPVLVPGDMGRSSWVLVGNRGAIEETFGSCCHGAGRVMSRSAAARNAQGRSIERELHAAGVVAKARSWQGLAEEQPAAYKDVSQVADAVHAAGLSRKVARLRPIGVIKG